MPTPVTSREWPNEIEEPVWFNNRQWAVNVFGLESLDPDKEYSIAAKQLLDVHHGNGPDRCGMLEQVGHKTWVDGPAFAEAFRHALRIHHPDAVLPFDLETDIADFLEYKRRKPD